MKSMYLLFFGWTMTAFSQGRLIENPIRNIPKWVRTEFAARHFDQSYSILYRLYPYYLRGDFNGDGRRDVAIQVRESESGKSGIAIFHGKKAQAFATPVVIVGAGKAVGRAGEDFKWVDIWSIFHDGNGKRKLPPLKGDAIKLEKREGTSGFIFWDGKRYSWYHLGK